MFNPQLSKWMIYMEYLIDKISEIGGNPLSILSVEGRVREEEVSP